MNEFLTTSWPAFFALFCRATAFSYAAPLLGERRLPPKFRVAVAALLAMSFAAIHPHAADGIDLLAAIPLELGVGFLAGFTPRVVLAGIEYAGEMIGLNIGVGFASTFDPTLGETALPVRRIAGALAGIAFIAAGGIQALAGILALPPVNPWTLMTGVHELIRTSGQIFELGLWVAAPVVTAIIVANVAMGLASRAAPALNVFSVMLALTAVVGALVLISTSSAFVGQLQVTSARAVEGIFGSFAP